MGKLIMIMGTDGSGKAAAEYYGWTVIQCVKDGAMRSIEDIHEEIYRHVAACLED